VKKKNELPITADRSPMNPGRTINVAVGLGSLLVPLLSPAQPAAPAPAGLDCMIQPHQVVQVGTASAGVIQIVRVDRGDVVRRGQPLVQMNADVERAALAVARERASQVGELQATRGAHDLATREAERAAKLVEENFVSRTFFDKQRAEAQVAAGRGAQAQERIKLAHREVELASAQLSQRTIVSPIDGVVVDRFVSPGEYVEQKPVLRIAAIDPLRVDVLVPAAHFGRIAAGSKASVVPELLSRSAHAATVTSVDRVVDAASNTFRVRLELPNPGGALPPGLRCKADLGLPGAPALPGADAARRDAPPATASRQSAPAPEPARVPPAQPAAAPVAPTVVATQSQVRRAEPPAPATAAPAPFAPQATARRAEPMAPAPAAPSPVVPQAMARRAEPAAVAATLAAAAEAPNVKSTTGPALIQPSPSALRLKMAPIEWPTTVATVTPRP